MTDEHRCYVDTTLNVIGGKWKLVILWHLTQGTLRFGELEKRIEGVTQKMLTQQLRELEKDQLIVRKVYPQVPPKVEYSITEHGRSLHKVLGSLSEWGQKHASQQY
jgi:DNA-binding HxlR family transcriptional regulator